MVENSTKKTEKKPHGILLIHGLMSSPVGMSSLNTYFEKKGYLVRSVLLPGHGTQPSNLLDVSYHDWLNMCRSSIKALREEVEHVTVIAFSAGTTLAIYLTLTEKNMGIDSLVLFAPALTLNNPLRPFIPFLYKLRNFSSKINWPILKQEDDYAKYQSLPINAVYQITTLMKLIDNIQYSINIPIYMVSSESDETVSHEKALQFFLKQKNPLNRGIIYTPNVRQFQKTHKNINSLTVRSSYYPEQNILDFSHTALAISPEHPHYGKQGDFFDFSHYAPKEHEKLKHKPLHYGAISRKNLKKHYIQRLSYNPDFDYLANDIDSFLKSL